MFNKGDKIVYPLYGAGIIEDIEEKVIDDCKNMYYVLKIPVGNLRIMVSASKADKLGLRRVNPSTEVLNTIQSVAPIPMPENWNVRYKENMERIKSGELKQVVEVFKTLIFRERQKSLSSAEKKMLGTTKQIILSEIIISQDVDKASAEQLLEESTAIMPA